MAKLHESSMKASVRRKTTRLLDEDGRTRAVLRCDGENTTLTLFDEQGRRQEVIRGLPEVFGAIQRMQQDPDCMDGIVASDTPLTHEQVLCLPPEAYRQYARLSQAIMHLRTRLQALGENLPSDLQVIAPWEEGDLRSRTS